jgi:DNA-binding NarL/FixJ family response regulator
MYDFSCVRLLVVDDSPIWRTFVIEHLYKAGLTAIDVAHDGAQAVHKAQTLQLDLILLDIALPRMNGIEAARVIRKEAPAVKIVFVSGIDDPLVQSAAIQAGGLEYVLKSLAGRDLIPAIRRALRGLSA